MCRTDQTHPRPIRRSTNVNTSRRRTRGSSTSSCAAVSSSSSSACWSLGRVGKLQIGVHGLLGLASLLLTGSSAILYNNHHPHQPENEKEDANDNLLVRSNRWCCCDLLLLAASQICNAILVFQAASLLPQVPAYTQIIPGVVAPHKEAFRRTISAMQYLMARVFVQWMTASIEKQQQQQQQGTTGRVTTSAIDDLKSSLLNYKYYALLSILMWRWYPLLPNLFHLEWSNGNTWIFVWPIFLGISGDLYQYVAWGDCVSIGNLLTGQLLGLGLAFGFTLGFRRYVPMAVVYALAAVSVWYIIQQGIVTIQSCNPVS